MVSESVYQIQVSGAGMEEHFNFKAGGLGVLVSSD